MWPPFSVSRSFEVTGPERLVMWPTYMACVVLADEWSALHGTKVVNRRDVLSGDHWPGQPKPPLSDGD